MQARDLCQTFECIWLFWMRYAFGLKARTPNIIVAIPVFLLVGSDPNSTQRVFLIVFQWKEVNVKFRFCKAGFLRPHHRYWVKLF